MARTRHAGRHTAATVVAVAATAGVLGAGLVAGVRPSSAAPLVAAGKQTGASAPVAVTASPFAAGGGCGSGFRAHTLAHTTQARGDAVTPYDTNGAGLAVGDLDADGRADLVLGDLRSTSSVLWNRGGFRFDRRPLDDSDGGLPESETRAVAIADLDGDGRPDIVTTHTRGGLRLWHNNGDRTFRSDTIDDVTTAAYALIVDDLDGDGDLDLITSSYDALLEKELKDSFLLSSGAGAMVYVNDGAGKGFTATRLVRSTQTLAMTLFDVDGDDRRDLIVGNDFGVPDMIWKVTAGAPSTWKQIAPFRRITKNTMGYAVGDVGVDGRLDLFASDMKPNLADVKVAAEWMPLMERAFQKLQRNDVQRAENVLQVQTAPGRFSNKGYVRHVDATGWSWSAQFGDLDRDGVEDLYVVNGMIDHEVLPYLPNDEIVERNAAFRAKADGTFARVHTWGLDALASGRAMAMADFDGDGRLDVVVNNLRSPSVVYENRLCARGAQSTELRLRWTGHQNVAALGAMVRVRTNRRTLTRAVAGTGGYLTGLDGLVHVGLGTDAVRSVELVWPDGAVSSVGGADLRSGVAGHLLTIERRDGSNHG